MFRNNKGPFIDSQYLYSKAREGRVWSELRNVVRDVKKNATHTFFFFGLLVKSFAIDSKIE